MRCRTSQQFYSTAEYICIYIYIYGERKKERERKKDKQQQLGLTEFPTEQRGARSIVKRLLVKASRGYNYN